MTSNSGVVHSAADMEMSAVAKVIEDATVSAATVIDDAAVALLHVCAHAPLPVRVIECYVTLQFATTHLPIIHT